MNIRKLNEEIEKYLEPKYFYIIGDSEEHFTYWDNDVYANVPDSRTIHNGYQSEMFDSFEEAIDELIKEDYLTIDERINFPEDLDLEDITEDDCTPIEYNDYYELFSYWTECWEEHGPEENPRDIQVVKFIQMFKKK